ncbi:MAG: hypothetical protein QOG88_1475 [Actinomycetota bacterium]|jgi:hypothetical protein|nr:hypothetical protein [Actinomycetota bacterium]
MIIFGFGGGRRTDHGAALPVLCPNCHNQTFYRYLTVRKWFSLFFIPLIPYSTKHYLMCPICSRAVLLEGPLKTNIGQLVELTAQLQAGSISQDAYTAKVRELGGDAAGTPPAVGPAPTTGSLPAPPPSAPPDTRPDGFDPQA